MSENETKNANTPARSTGSEDGSAETQQRVDRDEPSGSWFRITPDTTLVILVMLAAGLGLLLIQLEPVDGVPFWLMIFFFVMMIWKRSAFALACLFLVFGVILFFKPFSFPWRVRLRLGQVYTPEVIFTFLLLAFTATCFRFLETKKYCFGILSKFGWGRTSSKKKKIQNLRREFPSLLGGRWWLVPVSIVSSYMLLKLFPFDVTAVTKYWIKPEAMRLIFLIGTLFLVWFLARSIFLLIMRWKMDVDQASVHTRAMIAKEFWREHRAIESRRAKAISKNQRWPG